MFSFKQREQRFGAAPARTLRMLTNQRRALAYPYDPGTRRTRHVTIDDLGESLLDAVDHAE